MSESSKRVLSTLMVLGAISPERGMSADDLAAKMGMAAPSVERELDALVASGYAQQSSDGGRRRVYLTGVGVITASSTYS
jgi:DNA-binding IclR family transcriptional regulator